VVGGVQNVGRRVGGDCSMAALVAVAGVGGWGCRWGGGGVGVGGAALRL